MSFPDFLPSQSNPAVEDQALLEAPVAAVEDELPAVDPTGIIEEAEQLLRESAPHDFDVLIIGAGPGGYVAAIRAAQLGARVGLVEEREIGGVCLNRGCIPTKALLESVDVMRLARRAREYGLMLEGSIRPDFTAMNARKDEVVAGLRENVEHLLATNHVEVLPGRARFVEEHTVEITSPDGTTRRVTAVHLIIATGSLPQRLPVPGADLEGVVTSDELLQSTDLPRRLVVIGGGAVGVEFAYLFCELSAKVILLDMAPHILPSEDIDISIEMSRLLTSFGVELATSAKLERIEKRDDGLNVVYVKDGEEKHISTDLVLMASGRRPNIEDLGLEAINMEIKDGKITVDDECCTSVAGVYAIGDCVRDAGWAHQASGEGTMVAEIVTGHAPTVDLKHVPSCYYTHPEIASVGQTRAQAEKAGFATRQGVFYFRSNGRAAAAGDHDGFVKIVVDDESGAILGCQIIGPRATDLINQAVLALKMGQTVEEMVGAIHAHPTFSEALPEAALAASGKTMLGD